MSNKNPLMFYFALAYNSSGIILSESKNFGSYQAAENWLSRFKYHNPESVAYGFVYISSPRYSEFKKVEYDFSS